MLINLSKNFLCIHTLQWHDYSFEQGKIYPAEIIINKHVVYIELKTPTTSFMFEPRKRPDSVFWDNFEVME